MAAGCVGNYAGASSRFCAFCTFLLAPCPSINYGLSLTGEYNAFWSFFWLDYAPPAVASLIDQAIGQFQYSCHSRGKLMEHTVLRKVDSHVSFDAGNVCEIILIALQLRIVGLGVLVDIGEVESVSFKIDQ